MTTREHEIEHLLRHAADARTCRLGLGHSRHSSPKQERGGLTLGQRSADAVAATIGSWRFLLLQTAFLLTWLTLNVLGWAQHWDPYPFILLNLMLSFQAAYSAPILMMSQNRRADLDRQQATYDYEVNVKAEVEIEELLSLLKAQVLLSQQILTRVASAAKP